MSWYGMLVFLCLLFLWMTPTYAATSAGTTNTNLVTNGLVGHWTFDGKHLSSATATDVSGSGNNGVLTSMSEQENAVIGKAGQALRFNGVDETVRIPNTASINPNTITVSAWLKVTSGGTIGSIFSKDEPSNNRVWQFRKEANGTVIFLVFRDSDSTNNQAQSVVSVDDGKWHLVTGTWDGTNIRVYIDGVQSGSATVFSGILKQGEANNAYIGRMETASPNFFPGLLDEVRMYNRALTSSEIQALYKAGGGVVTVVTPGKATATGNNNTGPNSGLIGHWTFDGKNMTNATATDSSGSGNSGILTNMSNTSSKTVGKIGQGLTFNGGTQGILVATSTTYNNMSEFSIATWIYPTGMGGNSAGRIIDKTDNTTPSTGWSFQLNDGANYRFQFIIACSSGGSIRRVSANQTLKLNQWTHIAAVWNGATSSDSIRLFINGIEQQSYWLSQACAGSKLSDSTQSIVIGNNSTNVRGFQGTIDDVRIYNRQLTNREMYALYEIGKGTKTTITPENSNRTGINSGLVGHWTFDGKNMTNTTALDSSGNGRTGTLTNMTGSSSKIVGKLGQGLRFDGSNDLVNIPYNGIDFEYTQPITISAWVKLNDVTPPGGMQTIFGRLFGSGPATGTFLSWCRAAVAGVCNANSFALYLANNYTADGVIVSTATNSARPNAWTHITATYDGSGEAGGVSLYINGSFKSPTIHVDNLSSSITGTEDWMIGDDGTSDNTSGIIDDVRFYNRELTAKEVKTLYKLGAQ